MDKRIKIKRDNSERSVTFISYMYIYIKKQMNLNCLINGVQILYALDR